MEISAHHSKTAATAVDPPPLVPEPYLHVGPDRIYNPLTDLTIFEDDPGYRELRGLLAGEVPFAEIADDAVAQLETESWLVGTTVDLDGRFYLKYVALEANTACNQACFFCPVSVAPRAPHFMPLEQYAEILRQLAAFRNTIEAVSMAGYNEPTIDPRFVERVRMIKASGLPPAVLSNGSGLTPGKIEALLEAGGLAFFSVNLSTLDRERYRAERGRDHLPRVLRNLDYASEKPVADTMRLVVLGTGDEQHRRDYREIAGRFAETRFEIKYFEVNDRAGCLGLGLGARSQKRRLAGCELVGSRPLQHLHITPEAKCVLCCQDYRETHVVGDLNESAVREVLTGSAMKLMRRWAYGREEAPDDFICRTCMFSLRR